MAIDFILIFKINLQNIFLATQCLMVLKLIGHLIKGCPLIILPEKAGDLHLSPDNFLR